MAFVIHFVHFLFARPPRTTLLTQPHSSYLFVRQLFASLHSSQLLQAHRLRLCQKHISYCTTAFCFCTGRCKTLTKVSTISRRNYHCRYQNYRFWMTHFNLHSTNLSIVTYIPYMYIPWFKSSVKMPKGSRMYHNSTTYMIQSTDFYTSIVFVAVSYSSILPIAC